ncbi:MAG TPA: hypothetical protein VKR43_09410 [Bryobacteraceae bacterium]|nr:hypothetical protein [Bryobacteraceae bacterium]
MALILTIAEENLINAYRTAPAADRSAIIRSYASLKRLSPGRAEDALDLWAHMLASHFGRRPRLGCA